MRQIIQRVMLLAILAVPLSPGAQQAPVILDRLVPIARQKVLGLDTLTPEHRVGVVRLLQEFYQLGMQNGQQQASDPSQAQAPTATLSVIETQIDGAFNGWEDETIVQLMHGQIWQQTEYHYHSHYAFMPQVLIYRSGGGYKMKVDGVERAHSTGFSGAVAQGHIDSHLR